MERRVRTVVAYEFYWPDSTGQYQVVGVLPERRKDPERVTQESIMNWGINFFPKDLIIKDMFFIQVTIDDHTGRISRPIPFSVIRKEIPK
jgi:hypothetical protein